MKLPEKSKGTCLSRIQSISGINQKGVSKIARYVLAHPEEAVSLTISELAEKIGTSIASVSRFCTRLGQDNYRAFQMDLTASLANSPSTVSDIFRPTDRPSTIIERVFEINRQGLADTEKLLEDETLISVAKLIIRAKRVLLFGIGGSALIARLGALRFEALGITALAITDPYEGLLALASVTSDDVVFGISHTGRSALIIKLLKLAQAKGSRTVGITNYVDSPLAELSEFALLTSFRERRINAAVSSSRIAQMCILDALYFLAAYYQSSKAERLALQVEEIAEELLRAKC